MGIKITALMLYLADSKVLSGKAKMQVGHISAHIKNDTRIQVKKVWDSQEFIDPQADLTIQFDFDLSLHVKTADLERLFGIINAHLEMVEKLRKAEKDAERYAEAMFDAYVSADDLFDQDDLKHLDA